MHPPPQSAAGAPTTLHDGQPSLQQQQQQQPWNPMEKEAWLDSLDTRLGGDDIAAFVDGGDFAEWAAMSNTRGGFGAGGWLSQVWGVLPGGVQ